jgi:endo-beta-N-acetylglucosaminidase D
MKDSAAVPEHQSSPFQSHVALTHRRSNAQRKLSEHDQQFIQAMNDFVEKNGTITDDEFFRVL